MVFLAALLQSAQAAASSDPATQTGTAIVAILALIGLFGTFMKLTSDNRSDVNAVTASQIKQLHDDRKQAEANETLAYKARDDARQEAESWRTKYEQQKDQNVELRIQIATLRGTATNDG